MNAASPVCLELIDFIVVQVEPEALRQFRPSEENQVRAAQLAAQLMEGREEGTLSAEALSEPDEFVQAEHLMVLAKARARCRNV